MKTTLLHFYLLAFCLLPIGSLFAQPYIKWQKSFGNTRGCCGQVYNSSIIKSPDGNLVAASAASEINQEDKSEPGLAGLDPWVIKFDTAGRKIWDKTIREAGTVSTVKITGTRDGGYVLCADSRADAGGEKSQNARGGVDYWIIKLSATGQIEWDRTFGGTEDDIPRSVFETADGNYLVTGTSRSGAGADKTEPGKGGEDFWVVKFSAAGDKLWDRTFGGTGSENGGYAVQAKDGGYLIGGYADAFTGSGDSFDFRVFKIDADGNELWNEGYGGADLEVMYYMHAAADGGFILAGMSRSGISRDKSDINRGIEDGWMIKISAEGVKEWDRTLGGERSDEILYVEETADGGYLTAVSSGSGAGWEKSENSKEAYGSQDYWVVRLASDRSKVWDKSISGDYQDEIRIATEVSPGRYLLGGMSESGSYFPLTDRAVASKGTPDIWVVALSDKPNPETLWAFSVQKVQGTSEVTWQTASDAYSTRFEVQHSIDATQWNHINTVKSQGGGAHYCHFVHQLPFAGANYYRLKMIDLYDNVTYSIIRQVTFDPAEIIAPKLPALTWDKSIGNAAPSQEGLLRFPTIRKTPDGNFIMLAEATPQADEDKSEEGTGPSNPWVIKFTPQGTRIWDKTFTANNGGYPYAGNIIPTSDGGYLFCTKGRTSMAGDQVQPGKGQDDFWIVKLSADGSVLWDKLVGGPGNDFPYALLQTADGGFLVGGDSDSDAGGDKTAVSIGGLDYWIVRLSPMGEVLWDASFGSSGTDNLKGLQQMQDGGYLLAGSSDGSGGGDKSGTKGQSDFWLLKITPEGALQWEKTIGGPQSDVLMHVTTAGDGNFLLVGASDSNAGFDKTEDVRTAGASDGWVVKMDALGNVLWDKTLGGTDTDMIAYAEQTLDGGYLLSAGSRSDSGFDKTENQKDFIDSDYRNDYWLIKLNPEGSKVWDKTIGGSGPDFPYFGTEITAGNYFLAGASASDVYYRPGDRSVIRKGEQDIWMVTLSEEQPPLPVTLIAFNAQKENATVLLSWQTTSETRSDRFEVEHSMNGKAWNPIATVAASGESASLKNYQYIHQNPVADINYYRLKMVDSDETFAYSAIVRVSFPFDLDINVYPNPATETIHLQAPDWSRVKQVEMLNALGKVVYISDKNPPKQVAAKGFRAGLYFIRITNVDGSQATRRIVVGE
ncbi:T9SS type A sorting domain-containing protein [Dyadobacter sandarakinus]|uniref:T9SS type A sorting domain-containing protein n=1 Tax=Dyadobacter sandarakinus TaxID=2747268 RepID=A0ABX7I4Z4_9BACT|nr:T9SS type A sorting domain-containing protein [Dyadobacter sandarakinus]QRR01164.1 T9SS type A sorting domain-containing protein [Dyadobacter sandarakinus]